MAKAYGCRPSDLLRAPLGLLGIDAEVFRSATGIEAEVHEEAKRNRNPDLDVGRLVLTRYQREAAAERRLEERRGG